MSYELLREDSLHTQKKQLSLFTERRRPLARTMVKHSNRIVLLPGMLMALE